MDITCWTERGRKRKGVRKNEGDSTEKMEIEEKKVERVETAESAVEGGKGKERK